MSEYACHWTIFRDCISSVTDMQINFSRFRARKSYFTVKESVQNDTNFIVLFARRYLLFCSYMISSCTEPPLRRSRFFAAITKVYVLLLLYSSFPSGPTIPSLPARLHCLKTLLSSALNAPTTLWSTPLLWNNTKSPSFQSCA